MPSDLLAHKFNGKANLILDTLWLLIIQMLLDVLCIHDCYNGIQHQALSQKVLQRTQLITIPSSMCLYNGIHQQARDQKVLMLTKPITVRKRDSSKQVLLQPCRSQLHEHWQESCRYILLPHIVYACTISAISVERAAALNGHENIPFNSQTWTIKACRTHKSKLDNCKGHHGGQHDALIRNTCLHTTGRPC